MANIDRVKLGAEIRLKVKNDEEVKVKSRAFAEEVYHWVKDVEAVSPENPNPTTRTGPYSKGGFRESIYLRQGRDVGGRYDAHWIVGSDHPNANFIENGTGPDKPGSRSPWGPNTPTPEMAPFAKTAHHFGGTAP